MVVLKCAPSWGVGVIFVAERLILLGAEVMVAAGYRVISLGIALTSSQGSPKGVADRLFSVFLGGTPWMGDLSKRGWVGLLLLP